MACAVQVAQIARPCVGVPGDGLARTRPQHATLADGAEAWWLGAEPHGGQQGRARR
jgi:hypothetical protein